MNSTLSVGTQLVPKTLNIKTKHKKHLVVTHEAPEVRAVLKLKTETSTVTDELTA